MENSTTPPFDDWASHVTDRIEQGISEALQKAYREGQLGRVNHATPAPPPECLDCKLPHSAFPLDVLLPRAQWLAIHPADHGLLCAACIVKRAAQIPGAMVAHLIIEIAPQTEPRADAGGR